MSLTDQNTDQNTELGARSNAAHAADTSLDPLIGLAKPGQDDELLSAIENSIGTEELEKIQGEVRRKFAELTPEQKRQRAKKQQKIGRESLRIERSGETFVRTKYGVSHPTIISSVDRFFAEINTAISMVRAMGPRAYGDRQTTAVLEAIFKALATCTVTLFKIAEEIDDKQKQCEKSDLQITPEIFHSQQDVEIIVRSPEAYKFLSSIREFDLALLVADKLHWNGQITSGQIDDYNKSAKVALAEATKIATRSIRGVLRSRAEAKVTADFVAADKSDATADFVAADKPAKPTVSDTGQAAEKTLSAETQSQS
jgi:hypothetical protein